MRERWFRDAFELDLLIDRNAGSEVPLHTGIRPSFDPGETDLSFSYMEKIADLPRLDRQGDGMRSFTGVLLNALVMKHHVLLIDEPEAFLHPPQAYALGQMLSKHAPEQQLLIATHSTDFLRGLLNEGQDRLVVLRLNREGNINHVSKLLPEEVAAVWKDAVLRYSNVFDGLFHQRVVICEGDFDCRFYQAVLGAVTKTMPDILFVHSGGKQRIHTLARALRSVGVPITVIADFDVFSDEQVTQRIFESVGGTWNDVAADYKLVRDTVNNKKPPQATNDVRDKINTILAGVTEQVFPNSASKKIKEVLREASPWHWAKQSGKSYVPNGAPTTAYNRMTERFRSAGFHVVEIGELERFVPSVGADRKALWLEQVLGRNLATDLELSDARQFVAAAIPVRV